MLDVNNLIGISLFCVTDHHSVIEVKVISSKKIKSDEPTLIFHNIQTELVHNTEYNHYQHEFYFTQMYLRNKKLNNANVFTNLKDANKLALKNLNEKERILKNDLKNLLEIKEKLLKDLQ